uniref:Uncharacterized protein n=1 Tax=Siphoviridae sp. ctZ1O5 TaxID=2825555 RepID=A0A8S5PFE6_9CAUD|nr:MAG TPA: hypothetical protein [Siphoviridae sp. ctZ1O5]
MHSADIHAVFLLIMCAYVLYLIYLLKSVLLFKIFYFLKKVVIL